MSNSRLPTEVELVYEVMPCNAMRCSSEPQGSPHPCAYFRKWGTYHSFDYVIDGPPPTPGISQPIKYVGRASLIPEVLSGCRKAPIVAIGINPNLPGWFSSKRNALNPLFDNYKQFAHYFRYRAIDKLQIPKQKYNEMGGGVADTPFSDFTLNTPMDADGNHIIPSELDPQTMYKGYQGMLDELAEKMGWDDAELKVGEDLAYMNMVACPSARWTTQPVHGDASLPPMTPREQQGIVSECFKERRYFFRQLFQSLPQVIMVFSQTTANAFIGEMQNRFTTGAPHVGEKIEDLVEREIRLAYGRLSDGTNLEARVVFSPHVSGNPEEFAAKREKVFKNLFDEAQKGMLKFNSATKHLARPRGSCVFCPMLEIGNCDYEDELTPLSITGGIAMMNAASDDVVEEKSEQKNLFLQIKTGAATTEHWNLDSTVDNENG